MNNMKEHEFLDFIKRKAELAGACDVVQIVNKQPQYCDIAIGMRKDDDAKLVYVGKKHFNFGRGGRQKENVELSDAFKNYLENKKMLDKDNLERQLRRNITTGGRRSSSSSASRYKSKSTSRKKKKKIDRKRSSRSSSSDMRRKAKQKKRHHSSRSSSASPPHAK